MAKLRYKPFCYFVSAAILPLAFAVVLAKSDTQNFTLTANYGDRKTVSFEVKAIGTIKVQASWTGSATRLALILNGPGQVGYYQRADGPSPLMVKQEVTQAILAKGTAWSVSVVNFGRSGQAAGTLQLTFPDAPGTAPFLPKLPKPPAPGPPEPGTTEQTPPPLQTPLRTWLTAHPAVAGAIVWEDQGTPVAYPSWDAERKDALELNYNAVVKPLPPGPFGGIPANLVAQQLQDGAYPTTVLSAEDAWRLYVATVGHALSLEIKHRVPWTMSGYSPELLAVLFDSRSFFRWNPAVGGYQIEDMDGWVLPAPPAIANSFLNQNHLIRTNRLTTIIALVDWCRGLNHFLGDFKAGNVQLQWQYRGFPPVARMISGTPYTGQEDSPYVGGIRHRTAGCHGTAGFLRAVLRTVNVPVLEQHVNGHAIVCFASEDRYMSHADDPYSRMTKLDPPFPAGELLIDHKQYEKWFGFGVSDEAKAKNVGRRALELGLKYLPNYLLVVYCQDQAMGLSHVNGQVYATFKSVYTLEELEAQDLWGRMDAKIASLGGCGNVHE